MAVDQPAQVKVSVDAQIAAAFKQACLSSGVSMASVLSDYMAKFSRTAQTKNSAANLSMKRQRRTAVVKVIAQLQLILDSEQSYMDCIPENLHSSSFFESAEIWVSTLEETIDSLASLP